jgi:hypothetical protein
MCILYLELQLEEYYFSFGIGRNLNMVDESTKSLNHPQIVQTLECQREKPEGSTLAPDKCYYSLYT